MKTTVHTLRHTNLYSLIAITQWRQAMKGTTLLLAAALTVPQAFASTPVMGQPASSCEDAATARWNAATLGEPEALEKGERKALSHDGYAAVWWTIGCRVGTRMTGTACRQEALRVWNQAALDEVGELSRGERSVLSMDGYAAGMWFQGCQIGVALKEANR